MKRSQPAKERICQHSDRNRQEMRLIALIGEAEGKEMARVEFPFHISQITDTASFHGRRDPFWERHLKEIWFQKEENHQHAFVDLIAISPSKITGFV